MREFVAIEISPDLRASRPASAPDHLTLRFLGEVAADESDRIVERLRPVAREVRPFTMTLEGVGAFPTAVAPRVVWIGVGRGREEVTELARRVHAALPTGQEAEPFVPHLTWFRVRGPADRRAAAEALAGARPAPPPRTVEVREFVLKESVLGARGAVHRTIATFPLEGGRSVGD